MSASKTFLRKRPWILVSAYDVSTGATSEGYVAFNILQRLSENYRIILVTRRNNRDRLLADPAVMFVCKGMHVIGFDLPRWASWWKRGKRFYFPYAYFWQLCWPLALLHARRLRSLLALFHVLNFHNDSIPSLAWLLGVPVVWGPLNHNELAPAWRRQFWPHRVQLRARLGFLLRCMAWRIDPWLQITKRKAKIILSSGSWVDHRLRIEGNIKIMHLSQLGVDTSVFTTANLPEDSLSEKTSRLLVHAGRQDWIKGLDIAIEAMKYLPSSFRLLLVGSGPAETHLHALVKQQGLSERVKFKPSMSRGDLARIYDSAELFLFPSAESAGLAWVEALACGLPIVGFAGNSVLSETAEIMHGTYVAREGTDRSINIKSFAELIKDVTNRYYDREQFRFEALNHFGWDIVVSKIEHCYETAQK